MMHRKECIAVTIALLFCVSGCTVGPNYKRPDVNVPGDYRGLPQGHATQATNETFAQMKLAAVFPDEVLQNLLKEALVNNYDVRIAATRVLQAGADLGITRANQLPSVNLAGGIQNQRMQPVSGNVTAGAVAVQASWVLDFWGQYRRATEAARANLLGSEYAQGLVRITIISAVANAYFQLRAFDSQLDTSERTLETDKEIVRINTIKFKGGESAITDVLQAELLQEQAEAAIIALKQSIEQTENQISILLGRNPGPILRGIPLTQQPHMPEVPAGLPSAILERRPDVLQAEQSLVAANANVGVAKAAYFPQISLTGAFGVQSTALESFLGGGLTTAAWTLAGQVAQPIFEGGRITANYHLAWAQRDEAELVYKQTVLQAFGDVSNGLVGYDQSQQLRMKLEEQTATYKETARLANVRYLGGYTAFLEVLVTEQQYFTSEINLDQARLTELQNYVDLYQALGGGWQQ
ncbi:MAG TPA: efflux transporter outer membrane subunit [Candidatus Sulfotelmatobacter sp.]|jgi:multidrug efflux system outer membrane protein|nr:efflux transporter outer membrane subunit [Candidatus Sulfotelmatobacter sp.]